MKQEAYRRQIITLGGVLAAAATASALLRKGKDGSGAAPHESTRPVRRGATSRTTDRYGLGDVGIANFLLTIQRLEADLYRRALAGGVLRKSTRDLLAEFAQPEREHVARLERTVHALGGRTAAAPRVRLPLASESAFLQYAATLEDISAAACLGQLGAIDTRRLREVVLSIHTVDARHAAALGLRLGLDPTPDGAFAKPADAATALTKVRPLLRG